MWKVFMYKALYLFVHSIYTIFEYIHNTLDFVINAIVTICHEVLPVTQKNTQKNELHKINKIPTHLTVLVGHEEAYLKDLANLVIWCLATQISFISFYDCKGTLKKNEEELQCEINKRKCREDHVIWHSDLHSPYKNGFIGKKIHVKIITGEDGKNGIVNLAKTISVSNNRDISLENISENLYKKYEFPDPDLGLICGKTISFYNYPPWQIRVTEFFTINLFNITYSSFVEQILKYSKCEQRLGK